MIAYFDPFLNVVNTDRFGVVMWTPYNNIDLSGGWILSMGQYLNGYPLRAPLFFRYPTLVLTESLPPIFLRSYFSRALKYSAGYGGFDGLVLGNMAQTLNFKVSPVQDSIYLNFANGYIGKHRIWFLINKYLQICCLF